MTVYVDVGAKRIQAYLARTPRLRGRRGASALLEHELMRAWAGQARINPAGKHTDGVLSLELTDPDPPAPVLDAMLAEVTGRLQRLAPGAEWDVYVRRAEDYRQALRAGMAAERAGQDLLVGGAARYLPLPASGGEVPVVRFCETCGIDPAVVRTERVDPGRAEELRICADCSRRFLEGGFRTDQRNWTPAQTRQAWQDKLAPGGLRIERYLRDEVQQRIGRPIEVVADFAGLAALGSGDANHLCTVFVDGNRFGDLFAALEDADISVGELSADLATAITAALATATAAVVHDKDGFVPVVPHLVGGDDLLASVTAERAWEFVLAFLDSYHAATAELARRYGDRAERNIAAPTASAGMVFAHVTRPFADGLDLAEEALHRAKAGYRGAEPAVCWQDVTTDGPQLLTTRVAPTVATLHEYRAALDALGRVPASGRAELVAAAARGDVAVAALTHRLGRRDAVAPFTHPHAPIPLLDALAMVRWWPCPAPV